MKAAEGLNVFEIFTSFEGEGVMVGTPTIFLRLSGCSIRCKYCDTKEAQEHGSGTNYFTKDLIKEILDLRNSTSINRLSITGGNPLESNLKSLKYLIEQVAMPVNIEHPGIFLDLSSEIGFLKTLGTSDSISFDVKTPCTEVHISNRDDFSKALVHLKNGPKIFVKAVYSTEEDIVFLDEFLTDLSTRNFGLTLQPCITATIAKIDQRLLFKILTKYQGRLVPQIHKFLDFK